MNKLKKIMIFGVVLFLISLSIVYLLKPIESNHKTLGRFNIKVDDFDLVESYESERGIHGDGGLVKHFKLNQKQFKDIEEYLENFHPKKIYLNKEEYSKYAKSIPFEDWSEKLMKIQKGVYYIINRTPAHVRGERVTNFDLIILQSFEKSMYYIEIDM